MITYPRWAHLIEYSTRDSIIYFCANNILNCSLLILLFDIDKEKQLETTSSTCQWIIAMLKILKISDIKEHLFLSTKYYILKLKFKWYKDIVDEEPTHFNVFVFLLHCL